MQKMKTIKSIVTLGIASVMTLSMLTACADNANGNSAETVHSETVSSETVHSETEEIIFPLKDKVSFEGLGMVYAEQYPLSTCTTLKYLTEDLCNIEFAFTEIPNSEQAEKGNLIMASGEYPDFLFKMGALDLNKYGMDGSLIPLEELIKEYAPNITALLDERNAWDAIAAPDGHIYTLPNIDFPYFNGRANGVVWINQTWMDKLGKTMPSSMDELYDVLKAFKTGDPNGNGQADEIPINALGIWGEKGLDSFQVYMSTASIYNRRHVAVRDGELLFWPFDEEWKEWLEWMVKFYQEDLIYKDFFTHTNDQYKALGKSGNILGISIVSHHNSYTPEENWADYEGLLPFHPETVGFGCGVKGSGTAITDKCENPEVLVAWFDTLYTEENGLNMTLGLKDNSWMWTEDGRIQVIPTEERKDLNGYSLNGACALPCYMPESSMTKLITVDVVKAKANQFVAPGGVFDAKAGVILPELNLSVEDGERVNEILLDMDAYMSTYVTDVMMGKMSVDDSWENFKNTLIEIGAEEYFEIYKAAYEKALSD